MAAGQTMGRKAQFLCIFSFGCSVCLLIEELSWLATYWQGEMSFQLSILSQISQVSTELMSFQLVLCRNEPHHEQSAPRLTLLVSQV